MKKEDLSNYEKLFEKIIQNRFLSMPMYSFYLTNNVSVALLPYEWDDFWDDETQQVFRLRVKLQLKPVLVDEINRNMAEVLMGRLYWQSTSVDVALRKTEFGNLFEDDNSAFYLEMNILNLISKTGIKASNSRSEILFVE